MKEKSSFSDEENFIGNRSNNDDEVIVNSSPTTISTSRPPPVFVYVYNPWFLVLRIMHGILALITISEGIMAALLNHYSGYPVIGLCSSFGIFSFLISVFFTLSNFVDYRAFRIASLASICTSIITLICAIVTFNALGTLTACVSGTNRSYAPRSTFDYWIQSTTNEQYNIYYDRLVKCANRDPYAFRDCNCINTKTDNLCFKNIQAYDVCEDMLNYSPHHYQKMFIILV